MRDGFLRGASLHLWHEVAHSDVFGSSLNTHVHFHICVVDGVFEEIAGWAKVALMITGLG